MMIDWHGSSPADTKPTGSIVQLRSRRTTTSAPPCKRKRWPPPATPWAATARPASPRRSDPGDLLFVLLTSSFGCTRRRRFLKRTDNWGLCGLWVARSERVWPRQRPESDVPPNPNQSIEFRTNGRCVVQDSVAVSP